MLPSVEPCQKRKLFENTQQIFNINKQLKQQYELSASLLPIRLALSDKDWNDFRTNVLQGVTFVSNQYREHSNEVKQSIQEVFKLIDGGPASEEIKSLGLFRYRMKQLQERKQKIQPIIYESSPLKKNDSALAEDVETRALNELYLDNTLIVAQKILDIKNKENEIEKARKGFVDIRRTVLRKENTIRLIEDERVTQLEGRAAFMSNVPHFGRVLTSTWLDCMQTLWFGNLCQRQTPFKVAHMARSERRKALFRKNRL